METLRCRKLILGRDIGWICEYAISSCKLDLTYDFALVALTLNIFPPYISETVRWRKMIIGMNTGLGCRWSTSWCGFDMPFDLAVTLTFKVLSGLYIKTCKVQ